MSESKQKKHKSSKDGNSKLDEERIKETLLLRKRKDFKPWQPKSTYYRKRDVPLGTRLKGEIHRRLDRPYSEIDLSDNSGYNHFDEFEKRFEFKKNHVKDHVKSADFILDTVSKVSSKSTSFVTREIIPGNKPRNLHMKEQIKNNQQKHDAKVVSKVKMGRKKTCVKPKLLWSQSYEQAKRMKSATQKPL